MTSVSGRARLALMKAQEGGGDAAARAEVATAAAALEFDSAPQSLATLRDCLQFRAAMALRDDALEELPQILATFDKVLPQEVLRVTIRTALLRPLLTSPNLAELEEQTAALLADPLAVARVPKELVIEALGAVYERISPEACTRVFGRAHEAWKKHQPIEAMRRICECPAIFPSHAEATKWAKTVTGLTESLPDTVRADALCIEARCSEWDGDFEAMEEQAFAAYELAPKRPAACYWLTRALLQRPDGEAAAYLREGKPAKPTAEWERLGHFCALHAELQAPDPDLRKVLPVLDAVRGKKGKMEKSESGLAEWLLERALTSPWARLESNLQHTAELSTKVPGSPAWAEINLALVEIVLGRDYAGALRRLEQERVAEDPEAPPLKRAARILAGAPLASPPGEQNLLTLLENALRMLLGGLPAGGSESNAARLRDALVRAKPDDEHDIVSQRLAGVARVLGGLIDAASDPQAAAEWIRGGGAQGLPNELRLPWLSLLVTRIWLGMHARLPETPFLDAALVSDQGTARLVVAWWECHGLPGRTPAAVEAARGLREGGRAAEPGLLAGACELDDRVTSQLLAARKLLAAGRPGEAAPLVEALLDGPLKQSALSRNLWGPVCEYWLGLAEARAGRGPAALERAIRGVKGDEAKAQLALFALQAGDLEAAAGWVGPGRPATPAGHYARALLLHRQGEHAEADELLDGFADRWRETSPVYALAALRLRAAIAERAGSAAQAEELNRAVLARAPQDDVARARLTRLCVRRVYGADPAMDDATRRDLLEGAREIPGVPWHRPQAILCRIFTAPDAQAFDVDADDPASRAAAASLLQVRLRGLIAAGRQEEAAGLIERSCAAAQGKLPAWQRRAQLIFGAWAALRSLGRAAASPDARQKAVELAQAFDEFAPEENDQAPARWRTLLRRAVEGAPAVEPWPEFGEAASLPLLWAEDAALRQQTAAALAAVDSGASLPARFARFAAAWLTRQDDLCLELYAHLAADLGRLPSPAPAVWAAAGSIWLRRKQWKPLIVDKLPPEVRDLGHPEARLIVGVAYAQAAAEQTRSDAAAAGRRLQLARETLEPLLA
jgi:hypothetical protein